MNGSAASRKVRGIAPELASCNSSGPSPYRLVPVCRTKWFSCIAPSRRWTVLVDNPVERANSLIPNSGFRPSKQRRLRPRDRLTERRCDVALRQCFRRCPRGFPSFAPRLKLTFACCHYCDPRATHACRCRSPAHAYGELQYGFHIAGNAKRPNIDVGRYSFAMPSAASASLDWRLSRTW